MSHQDLRSVTSFGEKLLEDHNDAFRKQLGEKFEAIVANLTSSENLVEEQKALIEGFVQTGRTIVAKSARINP